MNLLRQSTSQIIRFGPELDSTDGVTPETGLTIAQADMQLSKDGAAFAQKNASGNATHDTDGWYSTTLNTTDTATNGILLLQINVAGALPVWHEFYVVPQASYDAFTTDGLNNFDATSDAVANVTLTATTTALTNVINASSVVASVSGNVDGSVGSVTGGATAASITALNDVAATDIVSAGAITTSSGAVSSVTTVATTTTNTDMVAEAPTASVVTDAVWDEAQSGHTTAGTFGKFLDVEVSSVSGGGGLTQQNVRDAMKLTPTGGSPSSGSVDEHLDDILTDTAEIANLNDFDPANDAVANVTLVATTTTNTDQRGTDGANTTVPDAAGVAPTATEITADMDANSTQLAAIVLDTGTTLPDLIDDLAIKKNTNFSNFEFLMVLTSDHVTPATGLTVTGQRSINGGAFTGVAGTIAEVSNGIYQFDALAADTNGDVITWRFSSATADDAFVTFKTVA